MSWASTYLIKRAVRLGVRLRKGMLSEGVVDKLRSLGMLRSPQRMGHGLDVGTARLMKKHNVNMIPFEMLRGEKPGPATFKGRIPALSIPALPEKNRERLMNMLGDVPIENIVRQERFTKLYGPKVMAMSPANEMYKGVVQSKGLTPTQWSEEFLPLIRRHEVNEVLSLPQSLETLARTKSLHTPYTLAREGEDLSGLSKRVRLFLETLRRVEGWNK